MTWEERKYCREAAVAELRSTGAAIELILKEIRPEFSFQGKGRKYRNQFKTIPRLFESASVIILTDATMQTIIEGMNMPIVLIENGRQNSRKPVSLFVTE